MQKNEHIADEMLTNVTPITPDTDGNAYTEYDGQIFATTPDGLIIVQDGELVKLTHPLEAA